MMDDRNEVNEKVRAFKDANKQRASHIVEATSTPDALSHVEYLHGLISIHHQALQKRGQAVPNQEFFLDAFVSAFDAQPNFSTVTAGWRLKVATHCFADRLDEYISYLSLFTDAESDALRLYGKRVSKLLRIFAGDGLGVASFSECIRICYNHFEATQQLLERADADDCPEIQAEVRLRREMMDDIWQGAVVQRGIAVDHPDRASFDQLLAGEYQSLLMLQYDVARQGGARGLGRQRVLEEYHWI
jgi:hypothetical protein